MRKLFTVFNCIIVLLAFMVGGALNKYEEKVGILTVAEPRASAEALPEIKTTKPKNININTAAAADLEALDGIGERLAERIIDYREEHGSFRLIEDIMKVNGIGKSLFDNIKDEIYVN